MLKLGCVPYMNALPLTYALDPKEVELIHRPPSELLDLLKAGKVEAALLPIVNYFENPELYLIPQVAIACRGAVKSVKLFFDNSSTYLKVPGTLDLKTIYLDPESRTSHALLKVLLRYKYEIDLEKIQFTSDLSDLSDKSESSEAKLLIGDKTFQEKGPSLDLGEEWYTWQQKPFVFAAWMTLQPKSKLTHLLLESKNQGLQNIDKIIEQISPSPCPLPPGERVIEELSLKDYFTKNIHYTMEDPELDGIRRFYELLKPIQGYHHELDFKFVS